MNDSLNLEIVHVHHDGDRWLLFDKNFSKTLRNFESSNTP